MADARRTAERDEVAGIHVVLMGQMGAGKTTIGRLVAAALDRPFCDNDGVLERQQGRTAAQIHAAEGTEHLHELERDVFEQLLARSTPTVIAAAASLVLVADPDELCERAFVVWLAASAEELAQRAAASQHRPVPSGGERELFDLLVSERDERYRRLAHLVVDVEEAPPHEAASHIVQAVTPRRT